MSAAVAQDISEDAFLDQVAHVRAVMPSLTSVGAGVLCALHFGICRDSRTFARLFGIAHALVLREVTALAEEHVLIELIDRNPRTQRTAFALTDAGLSVVTRAGGRGAAFLVLPSTSCPTPETT